MAVLLRRLASVASPFAAVLVVAPLASAGTVSLVDNKMRYIAASGEANVVTIGGFAVPGAGPGTWAIRDTGARVVVGPGCTSLDPHTASCTEVPPPEECSYLTIEVTLGDRRDEANGTTGQPCDLGRLIIDGGRDNDRLAAAGYENGAWVRGGAGDDVLTGDGLSGDAGNDLLVGVLWENWLDGGPGADRIRANDLMDIVFGRSGDDTIFAHGGNDDVAGGWGNDVVVAGSGSDVVAGGRGRDTFFARDRYRDRLDGGSGWDRARVDRRLDRRRRIERRF